MDLQIAFVNERVGPDASRQLVFADQLAWTFNQSDQYLKGTTAQTNSSIPLQQPLLLRQKVEGAE